MSWHCFCDDSTNESIPWVQIQVAFIQGGIPINMVCHARCLQRALLYNDWVLKHGCEHIDAEFEAQIERAEQIIRKEDI